MTHDCHLCGFVVGMLDSIGVDANGFGNPQKRCDILEQAVGSLGIAVLVLARKTAIPIRTLALEPGKHALSHLARWRLEICGLRCHSGRLLDNAYLPT